MLNISKHMSEWERHPTLELKAAILAYIKFTNSLADARNINWKSSKTGAAMKIPNDGLLSLQ